MDLNKIRREYLLGGLRRNNLCDNPFDQLDLWLTQAVEAQMPDPTAMVLATVGAGGQPEQRIVLLKGLDEQGLVFFTNYQSAKGEEIRQNPRVSALFPWHLMERQVRVCGPAEVISREESAAYFASRPRDSQVAAWASAQSKPLASRQVLLDSYQKVQAEFQGKPVPLPEFWGGYRIRPQNFEFWQGGANRLHDRFGYRLNENQNWQVERLAP